MMITVSGRPGSGKSVVAKQLAQQLGLRHVSAGDFMREMADERGLTILELSHLAEADDAIDLEIDQRSARLGEGSEGFVMDARLGWHFVPSSLKVFLDVRPEVAANRIYGARRPSERENTDLASTVAAIEARTASERERYFNYYQLDYTDHDNFDLVVDTSDKAPDQVVAEIVEFVRRGDSPDPRLSCRTHEN